MSAFAIKNAQTPSSALEHTKELAFQPADVQKAIDKKRAVVISELRSGRFPASIRLSGALTTDGINLIENDEYGAKWSFGLVLNDEADIATLQKWLEPTTLTTAFTLPATMSPADIAANDLFKDGTLYIKCPVNKDARAFAFSTNVKCGPKKPSTELFREMPVDAYVNVMAYLSHGSGDATPKWGLSLKLKHVDFWTDPSLAASQPPPATPPPETS